MNKILFEFNSAEIKEAYNQEYLDAIKKKYNDYLGYEGVIKVELVIQERTKVDRNSKLQPKLYSISPDDVDRIAQLYRSYDYSTDCEPQIITNRSDWDETVEDDEDEMVAGFKRDRAQNILKKEKLAFINNELMVYLRLTFADVKAFKYVKTLSNTVSPNENKQPNSASDIVVTLEECIAAGALSDKLYQLENKPDLKREIKCLTPDKGPKFRTQVENTFYAKTNKDVKYEIIYSGNIDDIATERGLPLSGKTFKSRNSNLYHTNSGEMKTTWYNGFKKLHNSEEDYIDIAFYVGKPVNIPKERFQIIRELLDSYSYYNTVQPKVDIKKTFRCLGFHTQAKQGLHHLRGKTELSRAENYILRYPFDWFHVSNEKEMKDFIKDNLTDIEKKNADEYFNDKITNALYDNIMSLYQCSLHYDEDKIECAA